MKALARNSHPFRFVDSGGVQPYRNVEDATSFLDRKDDMRTGGEFRGGGLIVHEFQSDFRLVSHLSVSIGCRNRLMVKPAGRFRKSARPQHCVRTA